MRLKTESDLFQTYNTNADALLGVSVAFVTWVRGVG